MSRSLNQHGSTLFRRWALLAPVLLMAGACARKTDPTVKNFNAALGAYLQKRGDLCLAKSTWPIDLTERDVERRTRDAVQLPVLERLGLVRVSQAAMKMETPEGPVAAPMKRYELTAQGRLYFVHREGAGAPDDFCAAKLSLDKVVGWELSKQDPGHALVTYTYRIDPAPWTSDAEIRRVFPAVARVIEGAGKAELKEGFTLTHDGWVANELLPPASSGQLAVGRP